MADYRFSAHQRFAIVMVHGQRCYMCKKPVDMTTPIDHVVPESLEDKPKQFAEARELLGLPDDFDLNSYENWLPCCTRCNGLKRDAVWQPSLLVQRRLAIAAERAPKARELAEEKLGERKLGRAVNDVLRAYEAGDLQPRHVQQLQGLGDLYMQVRPSENRDTELRVTPEVKLPLYEVLDVDKATGLAQVKSVYGRGAGPLHPSPAMRCGGCGLPFFNGARCVVCGQLHDD